MNIEEIEKKFASWDDDLPIDGYLTKLSDDDIKWLISRVKALEEGIRKHKSAVWGIGKVGHPYDEELYKLID